MNDKINIFLAEIADRPVRGRLRRRLAEIPDHWTSWTLVGTYRSPGAAATIASRLRTGNVDGNNWVVEWRARSRRTNDVFVKRPF